MRSSTIITSCLSPRTDVCSYSQFKIYPGHGSRYIRGDGKQFVFLRAAKMRAKKNPRRSPWTLVYRHLHKKGKQVDAKLKNRRRAVGDKSGTGRGFVGLSPEALLAHRTARPNRARVVTHARTTETTSAAVTEAKQAAKKKEKFSKVPQQYAKVPSRAQTVRSRPTSA
jgi:large subunit ribosomal protein L24e